MKRTCADAQDRDSIAHESSLLLGDRVTYRGKHYELVGLDPVSAPEPVAYLAVRGSEEPIRAALHDLVSARNTHDQPE